MSMLDNKNPYAKHRLDVISGVLPIDFEGYIEIRIPWLLLFELSYDRVRDTLQRAMGLG